MNRLRYFAVTTAICPVLYGNAGYQYREWHCRPFSMIGCTDGVITVADRCLCIVLIRPYPVRRSAE